MTTDHPREPDPAERRAEADEQRVILVERCERLLARWADDDTGAGR